MSLLVLLADAATEHGDATERVFPAFDVQYFPSQLFWLAITFGGLYVVLSRLILPRMGANLERRSDTIADDLDEAARLNEQAEEAKQALDLRLAQARANARETAAKTDAEIAEEIAEETRRVDAELDKKLETAEARITELRKTAMGNVESVATEATQAILARLGADVSAANAKKAVLAALAGKS